MQVLIAKDAYTAGFIPEAGVQIRIKEHWQISSTVATRNILSRGDFGETQNHGYQLQLTDISVLVSRKFKTQHTIGAGYLLRIRDNKIFHRFRAQYSFSQNHFHQRLRLEQKTTRADSWWFRIRYRFHYEQKFNQEKENAIRYRLSNEVLVALFDNDFRFENRFFAALVFQLTDTHRITTGPEYRLGNIFQQQKNHAFWLKISWSIRL